MNKTLISDVFNNELEYDPEVLRLYELTVINHTVTATIAPFVVDEPSIDALAKFLHDADTVEDKTYDKALNTLDENSFSRLTKLHFIWTLNGTEFSKHALHEYAEPKNYNILGVELKNGKADNTMFQTPDGRIFQSYNYDMLEESRPVMPSMQEMYDFVVEYKAAQLNGGKYRYPQFNYEKF